MFEMIPFSRSENSLFNYLDALEKNFFGNMPASGISQFRTDITDEGDHYQLKADLPGFKKKEIQIDLKDDALTIRAEHNEEREEKKDNYMRRERKYGSFARSFDVSGIDKEAITASYNDGVLELNLPKQKSAEPETKQISVD